MPKKPKWGGAAGKSDRKWEVEEFGTVREVNRAARDGEAPLMLDAREIDDYTDVLTDVKDVRRKAYEEDD
jgi:hypothetical protein